MHRLQNLRLDNQARCIKLPRWTRGVDGLRNSVFRGEITRATESDQHAAVFDELVELHYARQTHTTSDVVRLAVYSKARKLGTLGIKEGLAFRLDIENDRLRAVATLIRNHDDIVRIAQIALAHALFIYQVVADLEMIEGI